MSWREWASLLPLVQSAQTITSEQASQLRLCSPTSLEFSGKDMTRLHGRRQDSYIKMFLNFSTPLWVRRWLSRRNAYSKSTWSLEMNLNVAKAVILQKKDWQWLSVCRPWYPRFQEDSNRHDESVSIWSQCWVCPLSFRGSMGFLRIRRFFCRMTSNTCSRRLRIWIYAKCLLKISNRIPNSFPHLKKGEYIKTRTLKTQRTRLTPHPSEQALYAIQ